MGKYDNRLPHINGDSIRNCGEDVIKLLLLRDIANELAEKNRLKRLEMDQEEHLVANHVTKKYAKSDCEDKA